MSALIRQLAGCEISSQATLRMAALPLCQESSRGGGSSPDAVKEASSFREVRSRKSAPDSSGPDSATGSARSAAALSGQAPVQQSILEWSEGFAGMCPSIVQPGIVEGAAIAPPVASGLSAKPSAHRVARKSRITRSKYGEQINRVKQEPFRLPGARSRRSLASDANPHLFCSQLLPRAPAIPA